MIRIRNQVFIATLACLPALLGIVEQGAAQVPDVPGWQLVWHDEFEGTALNQNNWVPLDRRDSYNNEQQYYHPNQVTVADGNLRLTAINVPRDGKAYQSGLVTSKTAFGLEQPGTNYAALRVEARIDLPTTQGMWPAFWMNPNELIDWPRGGEIDIMENKGHEPNTISSAYHWQATNSTCCGDHRWVSQAHNYSGPASSNYHSTFHTYAVEWEPTELRFYVDDVLYQTVTETSATPANSQQNRPILEFAKYIILNVAVGGDFLDSHQPNGSTVWPQTMLVDYVRVWQRQSGLAGDYNNDGTVDAADYTMWRNSDGQEGIGLPADGSGNGSVGPEDYNIWKSHYNESEPAAGSGASSSNVPEPATAMPMTLGLLLFCSSQRQFVPPAERRE